MKYDLPESETVKESMAAESVQLPANANLRSEMAQEIISHKPSFMEKWALPIFLFVLLIILGITWFIKYPDVVQVRAILTASNAPKEIIARQEGRLIKLVVHNNEEVARNGVIAWLESTADHREVLSLSGKLDSGINLLGAGKLRAASALFSGYYYNLGEIQQNYQQFITARQQFEDYMINGFYSGKKKAMEDDIQMSKRIYQALNSQKKLTEQDMQIAEETFAMNKSLLDINGLSKEEFRMEKSRFVNKQMSIPQLEISLLNAESQQRTKLGEIEQLDNEASKQVVIFMQTMQSLKSSVNDWKHKYILESPVNGRVSFIVPLQENKYIHAGKLLGYINPGDNSYYAEAYLPQNNFGKIDTGLQVQMRFDAYPYQELGFIPARLSYVSNIPGDSGFLSTIKFTNGLITSNGHHIMYKTGLTGSAVIITSDMRLLNRLYNNLFKK